MRKTTFERMLKALPGLTPQQIMALDAAVSPRRREAEAIIEIESHEGRRPQCPHCGSDCLHRWGQTRTGLTRHRCTECKRTFSGLTGSPVQGIHRPDLLLRLVRDMFSGRLSSCRQAAERFGVSHMTIWRWRIKILKNLDDPLSDALAGIVEADEAFQRESRKGSREWMRHQANPTIHPRPPRKQWHRYSRKDPARKRDLLIWRIPMLTLADRSGGAVLEKVPDTRQRTIEALLLPRVRRDIVLCTDGGIQYENIARKMGFEHFIFQKTYRSSRATRAHHINTVSSCPIPDDHIDPRRSALFMARSLLGEVRDAGRGC